MRSQCNDGAGKTFFSVMSVKEVFITLQIGIITVKNLNIGTDVHEQIVQTQEQSDQGLRYLPFCLNLLNALLGG